MFIVKNSRVLNTRVGYKPADFYTVYNRTTLLFCYYEETRVKTKIKKTIATIL
jgi:hypothetical protein